MVPIAMVPTVMVPMRDGIHSGGWYPQGMVTTAILMYGLVALIST